jgi:hypothetical protein
MNAVQKAMMRLREARLARAAFDREVADGVKTIEKNCKLIIDTVAAEYPVKTRDECVLLTDEQYAEYARKHFATQLALCYLIAKDLPQKSDGEPGFDDIPTNLEF